MEDWDPDVYRRFEDERTRPAADLLAHVPIAQPRLAYDLGCGPGSSTELLLRRFPSTRVIGTDSSPAMLEAARERLPSCELELGDIAEWRARGDAPDLVFANAALQWLTGHERLFPRLFAEVAPGGVLAVQMPDNLEEPSHRAMRETASDRRWADAIGDAGAARAHILRSEEYYDLLAPEAASIDIWRTTYHHVMSGPADIVQWVRATGLKPFVEGLADDQQAAFIAEYERRIALAYPPRADGTRLLAFPRLFIVARRRPHD